MNKCVHSSLTYSACVCVWSKANDSVASRRETKVRVQTDEETEARPMFAVANHLKATGMMRALLEDR